MSVLLIPSTTVSYLVVCHLGLAFTALISTGLDLICRLAVFVSNAITVSPPYTLVCGVPSSFTCQPILVIIATLSVHHFFTLLLQAQNLPFQQILSTLNLLLYLLDCLHDNGTGPNLSVTLISLFLVLSFTQYRIV